MNAEEWAGVFALCFVLAIVGTIVLICFATPMSRNNYLLPNGEVCGESSVTGGSFGGATQEFRDCSDGKAYINPPYYESFKVEIKSAWAWGIDYE